LEIQARNNSRKVDTPQDVGVAEYKGLIVMDALLTMPQNPFRAGLCLRSHLLVPTIVIPGVVMEFTLQENAYSLATSYEGTRNDNNTEDSQCILNAISTVQQLVFKLHN